jgi:hypothetical protein
MHMPVPSERSVGWLAPKWMVGAVALAAFAMLMDFDLRLGLAAGALFGAIALVWLYIALRYGSLSGVPSVRASIVDGAHQHALNRRSAEQLTRGTSGPHRRPDPTPHS